MESPFRHPVPDGTRLIETFRFDPERGFHDLSRHLQRLERSARTLGFVFDRSACEQELAGFRADETRRCRLTLGVAGDFDLTTAPLAAGKPRWLVRIAEQRLSSGDPWLRHKTTQRALYDTARANMPDGVDELLFLNERDEVCEGTITNLFVTLGDGRIVTPPLACGCLPGVLRQHLLETGQVSEQVVTVQDLRTARDLHVGNSLRGRIGVDIPDL